MSSGANTQAWRSHKMMEMAAGDGMDVAVCSSSKKGEFEV
jgi:hypothetical protein